MVTIHLTGEKSVVSLELDSAPTDPFFDYQGVRYVATDDPLEWVLDYVPVPEDTDGTTDDQG
jgi:hypothetical protein